MMRSRLIAALTLSTAVALPLAAEAGREAITAAQIASAISSAGMNVAAEQVTLLTDVVARTSMPALQVQSMERIGEGRMRVRMSCANADECIPFFVMIHLSATSSPSSSTPATRVAVAATTPRQAYNSFTIRAGAAAILLLNGDHVHIKVAVVCLENGSTGQAIRVASQDRRQTYTAEVVDGTTLRGTL